MSDSWSEWSPNLDRIDSVRQPWDEPGWTCCGDQGCPFVSKCRDSERLDAAYLLWRFEQKGERYVDLDEARRQLGFNPPELSQLLDGVPGANELIARGREQFARGEGRELTPDAPSPQHRLRPGGVMRCCIATLEKRMASGPPHEGELLPCDHCSSGLIYRDGAWEWNRNA